MKNRVVNLIAILMVFWPLSIYASASAIDPIIAALLDKSESKIDFLAVKLAADKLVDPSIDTLATKLQVEQMISEIKAQIPSTATSMQKLKAIRRYLYQGGPWNQNQVFQYDFTDPRGQALGSKLLTNYIRTKKGNCVSMPILMLIISDRIGLDVSLSTAPLHLLMKFTESETGQTYNVEATSGGGFSRDVWYKESMQITDQAIRTGVYLQKLTRKESAYAMIDVVGEHLYRKGSYEKALDYFNLSLRHYPKNVHSMLKIGAIYGKLFDRHFASKFRSIEEVPSSQRPLLNRYVAENKRYFQMAESLGWREERPTSGNDPRSADNKKQPSNQYGN